MFLKNLKYVIMSEIMAEGTPCRIQLKLNFMQITKPAQMIITGMEKIISTPYVAQSSYSVI